jgi:hypothetical protein
MRRIRFTALALFAAIAGTNAQPPPQPPAIQGKITQLECNQWRDAIAGGYTLNAQEQSWYSQCVFEQPTGHGIAPAAETYVPALGDGV